MWQLWQLSARQITGRVGRSILTLISVIIGVDAIVSVGLAIGTTRLAYEGMAQALAGRAALEVVAAGNGSFPQQVADSLRDVPNVEAVVPVIQRPTILYFGSHRAKVLAMGIDPASDQRVREYRLEAGKFFDASASPAGEDGVLLDASFARSMDAKLGDELKILTRRRGMQHLRVVGLLSPQGVAEFTSGSTLFLPLPTAQRVFSAAGQVDRLEIVTRSDKDVEAVRAAIASRLPANLQVRGTSTRTQLASETMDSVENGLQVAGGLSLVLAVFIILNTFLMSVTERRGQLAVLRAIGATGQQVMRMLLIEGLVLGAVGSIVGIFVGIGGAYLLMRAIEQMMQTTLPAIHLSIPTLAFAGCLGIGLSLVAALIPARRAASVSPLEGMGGASADDLGDLPWRLGIIGSVLVVGGGAVLTGSLLNWYPNTFEVSSGLVILVGFVLMVPAGFRPLSRLAAWLPKRWVPTETDLARGQLLSHPIRAMLTVGILFIALVTEIALGTTILNIMHDVNQWLERTIVADFFVRAMMPDMSTGEAADVPEAVGTAIRKIPGIRRIGVVRFVSTRVDGQGVVLVAKDFPADEPLPLDLRVGSETEVRRGLAAGEVVLGSKLAARIGRTVGDEIELETKQGPHRFRIAGITNEYTLDGMAVFMDHSVAERQLGITGVDAYLISADSGALGSVEQALRKITDENGLLLQSAADVRRLVDTMMAGVVGGLWVLLALASLVAGFGVVNTLAMNVLEQTRELAILRVVAMTRRQIRHTILCQASILGSIGLLPATIVGVGMAYIMHVGTVHETSHLMNFAAHPALVLALLAIGYTIVLIAATMPAQRAARLNLLTALHYE